MEVSFTGRWNQKPGAGWESPEGTVAVNIIGTNARGFTYLQPFLQPGPATIQATVIDTYYPDNGDDRLRAIFRFPNASVVGP